ncbi:NAD(P)H-binding protein [Sphingomonas hengshuiensis]|nr:NAD(P)H-binding protein [Sphingomonas hengshuiensis]
MQKTILILGATGGVGGETASALLRHGWAVRGLVRGIRPGLDPAITWFEGDAMDRAAVLRAAEGVSAVFHAVNPPGYRDWDRLVLPMVENSIAAALANDARLVLPGTIYNYDPAVTPVAVPDSPQSAQTRKGRIRVAMERRIQDSGVAALIVRAGDFFGPKCGNGWLAQGLVKPGQPVAAIQYPGAPGAGHAWAYLPDLAETFALLLDRDAALPRFARFHFAGVWDADGSAFTGAIARAAGTTPTVKAMPWALLALIAPFNTTMRELREMRPFWQHPLRLDNAALVEFLGSEPHTPLDDAMRASLAGLGCIAPATA